jgi:hypothetical protein
MKKITKIFLGLVASISITASAVAGELTVTGSANASYVIGGADDAARKGIGISNELAFGASGEFDNGYTWTYNMDLDPNTGGTVDNDDQSIVFGMGDLGTVGVYVSEGGLSKEYGFGIGALGPGSDYAGVSANVYGYDVSNHENIQYHSPSGFLPLGAQIKVGYAPEAVTADSSDKKTDGSIVTTNVAGENATHYQLTLAPIDGLSLGADYYTVGQETNAYQKQESGNAYAKYTFGNISVGYGKTHVAPGLSNAGATRFNNNAYVYETDNYGIQFDVNDQLSVSYSMEKSERGLHGASAAAVRTKIESEIDYIQAAYTIGGASLGVAVVDADNSDYTSNKEEKKTVFSIGMAF